VQGPGRSASRIFCEYVICPTLLSQCFSQPGSLTTGEHDFNAPPKSCQDYVVTNVMVVTERSLSSHSQLYLRGFCPHTEPSSVMLSPAEFLLEFYPCSEPSRNTTSTGSLSDQSLPRPVSSSHLDSFIFWGFSFEETRAILPTRVNYFSFSLPLDSKALLG
jgi:hypothetical protein